MGGYGVVTEPGTVRIERVLPGPVERVWGYLTDPDKRGRWLASGGTEPRVGGRVELAFDNTGLTGHGDPPPPKHARHACGSRQHGRVTAWEPPRLLGYTWGEGSGEPSEVRFELTPRADGVLLVVTHRRLATRDGLIGVAAGWHAHLGILADRLAGRAPPGFWATHARLEAEYERRVPGG